MDVGVAAVQQGRFRRTRRRPARGRERLRPLRSAWPGDPVPGSSARHQPRIPGEHAEGIEAAAQEALRVVADVRRRVRVVGRAEAPNLHNLGRIVTPWCRPWTIAPTPDDRERLQARAVDASAGRSRPDPDGSRSPHLRGPRPRSAPRPRRLPRPDGRRGLPARSIRSACISPAVSSGAASARRRLGVGTRVRRSNAAAGRPSTVSCFSSISWLNPSARPRRS